MSDCASRARVYALELQHLAELEASGRAGDRELRRLSELVERIETAPTSRAAAKAHADQLAADLMGTLQPLLSEARRCRRQYEYPRLVAAVLEVLFVQPLGAHVAPHRVEKIAQLIDLMLSEHGPMPSVVAVEIALLIGGPKGITGKSQLRQRVATPAPRQIARLVDRGGVDPVLEWVDVDAGELAIERLRETLSRTTARNNKENVLPFLTPGFGSFGERPSAKVKK